MISRDLLDGIQQATAGIQHPNMVTMQKIHSRFFSFTIPSSLGIQSPCDMIIWGVQSHSQHGSDYPQKVIGSLEP